MQNSFRPGFSLIPRFLRRYLPPSSARRPAPILVKRAFSGSTNYTIRIVVDGIYANLKTILRMRAKCKSVRTDLYSSLKSTLASSFPGGTGGRKLTISEPTTRFLRG